MLTKQHARSLVGLLAASALIAAVMVDLLGVARLENRHIMILSGIASAALGLDLFQHRYKSILETINTATDPWSSQSDSSSGSNSGEGGDE